MSYLTFYGKDLLVIILLVLTNIIICVEVHHRSHHLWENNVPAFFQQYINSSEVNYRNELLDIHNNSDEINRFEQIAESCLNTTDNHTDGEHFDAMEHFFWGKLNGIAMELGALDGSNNTYSMTYPFEKYFGWKRILVEGNVNYRLQLKSNSPQAYSVTAAICEHSTIVHYAPLKYVGGIVEFMGNDFLARWHPSIYKAGIPPGNISSINWKDFERLVPLECIPLAAVFHRIKMPHVNFFVLDVEGGELQVLKSIAWEVTTFDVICVETKGRKPGFTESIIDFLQSKGYKNETAQIGRNHWFINNKFNPSTRPQIGPNCFKGASKSHGMQIGTCK